MLNGDDEKRLGRSVQAQVLVQLWPHLGDHLLQQVLDHLGLALVHLLLHLLELHLRLLVHLSRHVVFRVHVLLLVLEELLLSLLAQSLDLGQRLLFGLLESSSLSLSGVVHLLVRCLGGERLRFSALCCGWFWVAIRHLIGIGFELDSHLAGIQLALNWHSIGTRLAFDLHQIDITLTSIGHRFVSNLRQNDPTNQSNRPESLMTIQQRTSPSIVRRSCTARTPRILERFTHLLRRLLLGSQKLLNALRLTGHPNGG